MSYYIIHGENVQLSRQKLYEIKSGFDQASVTEASLGQGIHLENTLFTQTNLVVLEIFESDQLKEFDMERYFENLKRAGNDLSAVLWFGFKLTKTNKVLVQCLKFGFLELKFSLSPIVFKLADCFFSPTSFKNKFYSLLYDFGRSKGDEIFLIQMLIKNSRLKLWSLFKNKSYLSLSGFSKKQAELNSRLTKEKLLKNFEDLVSLERRAKSGPVDLVSILLLLYESL